MCPRRQSQEASVKKGQRSVALAKASSEELIQELRRRLTGATCPSCKSVRPTLNCTNQKHLEQAMVDAMPGGVEATF